MSLHRNEFLVSSHQAELHRQAADARLARLAMAPATATERKSDLVARMMSGLVTVIRPVRRVAVDAVKAPAQTTIAPSGSGS